MNRHFLSIVFLLTSFVSWGQLDFGREETFFEDRQEFIPSLSNLAPDFPESRIKLREVDFSKKMEKPQINMVAIMEREKNRTPRTVEIHSPFQKPQKEEKSVQFELSDGIRSHSRGWNYDPYTGKTRNSAYREYRHMRSGLHNGFYRPTLGSRYYSPYSIYY